MKVYTMAKVWAILIYIVAPLVIGLFGWLLLVPFFSPSTLDMDWQGYLFIGLLSAGMIFLMVVGILEARNGKITISNDLIMSKSVFGSREILTQNIKGFRLTDKYIVVESIIAGQKKVSISTYTGKKEEIIAWLQLNFHNLDLLTFEEEKKSILKDEQFGRFPEEREEKLKIANKTSSALNWAGGIVSAWCFFYPSPYEYAILAAVVLPLLSFMAALFFQGLIRVFDAMNSAYPSVFVSVYSCPLCLVLRAMLDFNIYEYTNMWTPVLVLCAAMFFFVVSRKEFDLKKGLDYFMGVIFALIMFCYSYGAIILLNCIYDNSKPEIYRTLILDKSISSGKVTTYHFSLDRWSTLKEATDVTVTQDLFESLQKGDSVTVYKNKGEFEIPWFQVGP